jgi:DNA-binding NarL/FixJ family response regulator
MCPSLGCWWQTILQVFEAICSMLSNRSDLLVVAEASVGLEAVRKAEELQPDLVVLDLSMPKLNGLEATRRICTLSPKSMIIIASLESSADFVQEALRSGAEGYVIKVANQLLPAIEAVLRVNAGSLSRRTIFSDGHYAPAKRGWALNRGPTL